MIFSSRRHIGRTRARVRLEQRGTFKKGGWDLVAVGHRSSTYSSSCAAPMLPSRWLHHHHVAAKLDWTALLANHSCVLGSGCLAAATAAAAASTEAAAAKTLCTPVCSYTFSIAQTVAYRCLHPSPGLAPADRSTMYGHGASATTPMLPSLPDPCNALGRR